MKIGVRVRSSARANLKVHSFCFVLILGISSTATGQPVARDPAGAEKLFQEGLQEIKKEHWKEGCQKFQASMDLDPSASTQFNIAKCREHEGLLATAWSAYKDAEKWNRDTKRETQRARLEKSIGDALAAIEPRVPKLRISVSPDPGTLASLKLWRDGALIPNSVIGQSLPVDPGQHQIRASAAGYGEQAVTVVAAESGVAEAAVTLAAEPPATVQQPISPTGAAPAAAQSPPESRFGRQPERMTDSSFDSGSRARSAWGQRQTALVVGGAGVATLGVAGYFGIKTLYLVGQFNDYKTADGRGYTHSVLGPHDRAVRSQNTGFVLAGVGAAVTGVGVALYFTAPPRHKDSKTAVSPSIKAVFTPTGLAATGEW